MGLIPGVNTLYRIFYFLGVTNMVGTGLNASIPLCPRSRVHEVESLLRSSEGRLCDLESSRNDKLKVFGPWMRDLVDAIAQSQQQFRKVPKGPMGALIGLKDYRWAECTEAILKKRFLYSFITDNPEDDRTLKSLMRQVIRDKRVFLPDTITSRFEVCQR